MLCVHLLMKRQAFTLIELLTVISVIALLLGILLPVLSMVRTSAYRAQCASQLKGVGVGLQAYLNDHQDIMPIIASLPSANLNDLPSLAQILDHYLETPDALACVADDGEDRTDLPGQRFFDTEASSYAFRTNLGGKRAADTHTAQRWAETHVWVMRDYESFHGKDGEIGSRNYLFADGHVEDLGNLDD